MKPNDETNSGARITAPQHHHMSFWIKGITPLIQHAWSDKALKMMRMTAAERRKVPKTARDPEEEAMSAACRTKDGRYGVPAMAIKSAMIEVAHKDIGLPKTSVRKALRFRDAGVLPMVCSDPVIREDMVRVGNQQTDIRYRPQFDEWAVKVELTFDPEYLTPDDIINLVNRAGFSTGIGEWRPERDGEFGCFEIDATMPVEVEEVVKARKAA